MAKQKNTLKKTRDILIDYIKNIPEGSDIDKFMFTYESDSQMNIVSNLETETIDVLTVMEKGLASKEDREVLKEIVNESFERQ